MRPAGAFTVPVPSSSLLHFLRSQSEQVCFFPPLRPAACRRSQSPGFKDSTRRIRECVALLGRTFTTTARRQANIESSLLNLDLLRPSSKHGSPNFPYISSAQRPGKVFHLKKVEPYRHVTTDPRPLLRRLWAPKDRKGMPKLKSMDLPPLPNFLDEVGGIGLGRNKTGKAGNELKLRCTELDVKGNVTLMDGEFKKTELIAKV